ncbi:calmodulin-interacting protein 111-like [Hyalella azteca]|uniref:Peroxisomal ATPase PEX6 n=1 Tax=Hyalella azteca TaxID=294128 RepID=A0A8B7NLW4_HYAAZ|nr:calmodulin-interacting protein 111-like [Hyalella azteca]
MMEISALKSIEKCLALLLFCWNLLSHSKRLNASIFIALDLYGKSFKKSALQLIPLSSIEMRKQCINCGFSSSLDPNSVILVNPYYLTCLKIRSGSWCLVQCHVSSARVSRKQGPCLYWVRLVSNALADVHTSYCSPALYHIISHGQLSVDVRIEADYQMTSPVKAYFLGKQKIEQTSEKNCVPCVASSVSLSLIEHSKFKWNFGLESILEEYFENPKLVSAGNVVTIPAPSLSARNFADEDLKNCSEIQVLIESVKCKGRNCSEQIGHIASCKLTQFCLGANVQASTLTHHLHCQNYTIGKSGDILIPPHLKNIYISLERIILSQIVFPSVASSTDLHSDNKKSFAAEIQSSSSLVPSEGSLAPTQPNKVISKNEVGHVLLDGCRNDINILLKCLHGSLGLCISSYEAWKLKGDTSSSTEAKIQRLHQLHLNSSPAVIILHDVDQLLQCSDSSGGDDRVRLALSRCLVDLSRANCLVIGTILAPGSDDSPVALPDGLWQLFTFQITAPGKIGSNDQEELLYWLLTTKYSQYVPGASAFGTSFGSIRSNTNSIKNETSNKTMISTSNTLNVATNDKDEPCITSNMTSNKNHSSQCHLEQESPAMKSLVLALSHCTAGFTYCQIEVLLSMACELACEDWETQNDNLDLKTSSGSASDMDNDSPRQNIPVLREEHIMQAAKAVSGPAGVGGAGGVPVVLWQDVGALDKPKQELVNTINIPLNYPHLVACGIRRAGVLLYGPPGTGKTLLAKAVASECRLNFLSVKGPELLNMYVGETERNVRKIFAEARGSVPCVIFFDELDALAPNRGASGDSGGVMDRVVSAVVAELDECSRNSSDAPVFVLGATNRPDLIDPALLRPGRFEKLLYLGPCTDSASLIAVLKAVISKLPLGPDVSLARVVAAMPRRCSGADVKAAATNAFYAALRETVAHIRAGDVPAATARVVVTEAHLTAAARRVLPSVTADQLATYQAFSRHTAP